LEQEELLREAHLELEFLSARADAAEEEGARHSARADAAEDCRGE